MRAQADERSRFGENLQDRPGLLVKTDPNNRERLTGGEALAGGTVHRVSDGHRVHFALGTGSFPVLPGFAAGVLAGRPLSNPGLSRNLIGLAGGNGGGDPSFTGSTMRGVTKTRSSLLLRFMECERKRFPRIGMSPMPGTLLNCACARLSNSPAIPNDCPSFSSMSVSARRVESAGTVKPDIVTALPKSNVLTSGMICIRITRSAPTTAVKSSLTPKGRN